MNNLLQSYRILSIYRSNNKKSNVRLASYLLNKEIRNNPSHKKLKKIKLTYRQNPSPINIKTPTVSLKNENIINKLKNKIIRTKNYLNSRIVKLGNPNLFNKIDKTFMFNNEKISNTNTDKESNTLINKNNLLNQFNSIKDINLITNITKILRNVGQSIRVNNKKNIIKIHHLNPRENLNLIEEKEKLSKINTPRERFMFRSRNSKLLLPLGFSISHAHTESHTHYIENSPKESLTMLSDNKNKTKRLLSNKTNKLQIIKKKPILKVSQLINKKHPFSRFNLKNRNGNGLKGRKNISFRLKNRRNQVNNMTWFRDWKSKLKTVLSPKLILNDKGKLILNEIKDKKSNIINKLPLNSTNKEADMLTNKFIQYNFKSGNTSYFEPDFNTFNLNNNQYKGLLINNMLRNKEKFINKLTLISNLTNNLTITPVSSEEKKKVLIQPLTRLIKNTSVEGIMTNTNNSISLNSRKEEIKAIFKILNNNKNFTLDTFLLNKLVLDKSFSTSYNYWIIKLYLSKKKLTNSLVYNRYSNLWAIKQGGPVIPKPSETEIKRLKQLKEWKNLVFNKPNFTNLADPLRKETKIAIDGISGYQLPQANTVNKKIEYDSFYSLLKALFNQSGFYISKPIIERLTNKINIRLFTFQAEGNKIDRYKNKINNRLRYYKKFIRTTGKLYTELALRIFMGDKIGKKNLALFLKNWTNLNNKNNIRYILINKTGFEKKSVVENAVSSSLANDIPVNNSSNLFKLSSNISSGLWDYMEKDKSLSKLKSLDNFEFKNIRNNKIIKHLTFIERGAVVLNQRKSTLFNLKRLILVLQTLFNKKIELDLTRLQYPYHESHILSQVLGHSSQNKYAKFFRMMQKLSHTANIYPKGFKNGRQYILPSILSGFKVKLAGRLLRGGIIPRYTVNTYQLGTLSRGNSKFKESSRITLKNKRGAYSFTVTIGHFFDNLITNTPITGENTIFNLAKTMTDAKTIAPSNKNHKIVKLKQNKLKQNKLIRDIPMKKIINNNNKNNIQLNFINSITNYTKNKTKDNQMKQLSSVTLTNKIYRSNKFSPVLETKFNKLIKVRSSKNSN